MLLSQRCCVFSDSLVFSSSDPILQIKCDQPLLCDLPPLLSLACSDVTVNQLVLYTVATFSEIITSVIILISYLFILITILRMHSAEGRWKAFSTCASHLTSVTLFYGTANMTYLQPKSGYSPETKKLMSLAYTLLTPLLNPLIYSLRNSEMKRALMKLW